MAAAAAARPAAGEGLRADAGHCLLPEPPESFWYSLKCRVLEPPLVTGQLADERLSRPLALGVLSCDGLSSAAYGTEEILYALCSPRKRRLSSVAPPPGRSCSSRSRPRPPPSCSPAGTPASPGFRVWPASSPKTLSCLAGWAGAGTGWSSPTGSCCSPRCRWHSCWWPARRSSSAAHIAGIEPGTRIRLHGKVGIGADGRPVMANPAYELLA